MNNRNTILIVDDDFQVKRMVERLLKRAFPDNTILTADNGDEAIRIIEEQRDAIAVVVTDTEMPIKDGNAVARHVFEQNETPKGADESNGHIEVIICSGRPESIQADVGARCSEVLHKPFLNFNEVVIAVDEALVKVRRSSPPAQ